MVLRQDSHCTLKMGYILRYFFIFVPPMYWITWGMSFLVRCAMQNALINYLFFCLIFFFFVGGGGGGGGGEKISIQSKKILYLLSIYHVLQTLKCPLE